MKQEKKSIFKIWWFWVLVVVLIASASGNGENNNSSSTQDTPKQSEQAVASADTPKEEQKEVVYTDYTVSQLMNDLESNAMKAQETYKGKDVSLTGKLSNIDSSGKYINITPAEDEWAIIGVQCYIKNNETKKAVMDLTKDDIIVVKGHITDVGEVLGYSLDIDSISK